MGVQGLWKLLESTGKPINPETLQGKILAVDISIWLNQAVKGVRDREGNNVHNAHLLTLFNRLCKLLFFRIKPVFVYDGDAPLLKRQTLASRRQRKEEMALESKQTHEKLLKTFLKRQAIRAALGDRSNETIPSISSVRRDEVDEMYVLPALPPVEEKERSSSDEEPERDEAEMQEPSLTLQDEMYENPNSVDINSEEFNLLSPEIKHEILKDMKEFSKRRRTLYHKPPERSGDFSQYQLAGLLQRNNLNQRLEGVEKEMSQQRCGDAEEKYSQSGEHSVESNRLISEDSSHYILIKGTQKSTTSSESHPVPDPWSCGPWSRKGSLKGKPEPLWRPVSDGILEERDPSSSSSSSPITKKLVICSEQQPSEGAPPSPRTLQAIQAAMMDSSSDEDESSRKKMVRDGSFQDGNGGVSPRTSQAIQRALMEDNNISEDLCKEVQTHHQKKYVIISSSDDDKDDEDNEVESMGMQTSVFHQAREGGGVSPQTLLAIQRVLGEKETLVGMKQEEHKGFSSSSVEEEMKEIVGASNKEFKASTLTQEGERKKVAVETAFSHSGLRGEEEKKHKDDELCFESTFIPKDSFCNRIVEKEERNQQITEKSEEDESSSEEGFIEVSEGEEVSEPDQSINQSEEQFVEVSSKEELIRSNEEERKEKDSILSLNISETEEQESESPGEATAVPAPREWDNIDMEELIELEKSLHTEQSSLHGQQQQQQRSAATVTGQMCQESQELLRLFGVPFIVAPMEAEAQCAALDRMDQTHGTITEDSDVWLFGGRHVYKNFFKSNKYVEHYQYLDIQNQLGLDRTKLINLAYLLGSDYTEGIAGVGYVTGMEILNEFPGTGLESLALFSKWWNEAQSNKKLAADPKNTKVKKKLRALNLHPGFPNPAVAEAYLQPTVDQSEGSFCWGHPQLDLLKEFCYSRFGWNSKKTEETLQPVLKQLGAQQTQLRIDSFFRLEQQEKHAIRSQRLRRAVTCLKRKEREGADNDSESSEDEKVSPVKRGKNEKKKGSQVMPAGMFGGGFLGLDASSNPPEENVIVCADEQQHTTVGDEVLKVQSSSSSSEDEVTYKNKVTMVTARSVFEGKTRGRRRRGGQAGRGKKKL